MVTTSEEELLQGLQETVNVEMPPVAQVGNSVISLTTQHTVFSPTHQRGEWEEGRRSRKRWKRENREERCHRKRREREGRGQQ